MFSKGQPIISLCIPTNGITEWVFPVLDAVYNQKVDNDLFEIVLTDNGDNREFKIKAYEYAAKHENLIYKETHAHMFDNQLEALKLASGAYLQFLNHRSLLLTGGLKFLIDCIKDHEIDKPVIYFSNGALDWNNERNERNERRFDTFDGFVNGLGRYASWTSGVGIWKEKYDRLPKNLHYDQISPHSSILFSDRHSRSYIINNCVFFEDIETDHSKKGKYDLFKAFGVEEFSITLKLYLDGDISAKTLKSVKKDYGRFLSELYFDFVIRKIPCSYNLNGFEDAMGIFFSKSQVRKGVVPIAMKRAIRKIIKIVIK